MKIKIPRCYDSHVHLLFLGQFLEGLNLRSLKSPSDIRYIEIKPQYFRGQWLVGFGWDQYQFLDQRWPTKEVLDQIFPDFPVAFSRVDGHTTWLNSKALEIAGYLNKTGNRCESPTASGIALCNEKGEPTGILIDNAKTEVDLMMPPFSLQQNIQFYRSAIHYMKTAGFTHVRDMTGSLSQWKILQDLDLNDELPLYTEMNFVAENFQDFPRALAEAKAARELKSKHLRVLGIKVFLDGALGSEGAYLSQSYSNSKSNGRFLWNLNDFSEIIKATWNENFEISFHAIGDQAVHEAAVIFDKLAQQNIRGKIAIEHAEIVRKETVQILSRLVSAGQKVVCHMQPCHFHTDKKWLRSKIANLYDFSFPWRDLHEAGVKIQWGSDAPIEEASVENNIKALKDSSLEGIPAIEGIPWSFHVHPDPDWGGECVSELCV